MTTPAGTPTDALLQLLDGERAALLETAARVPPARRGQRPAADRWSVNEILEHVSRIDRRVANMIAASGASPLTATPEQLARARLTPKKAEAVRGRQIRVQAPQSMQPTGRLSFEAVVEDMASARALLKAAYLGTSAAVLDGALQQHPFLGQMTLRSWVEFAAHHDARHARQIAEIVDTPVGSAADHV